jgi:hypothetical protein
MITFYPQEYKNNELQKEKIVLSEPFNVITITDEEEISRLKNWRKEALKIGVDVESYIIYKMNDR